MQYIYVLSYTVFAGFEQKNGLPPGFRLHQPVFYRFVDFRSKFVKKILQTD